VEVNSTGGQGSHRAVALSDDDDDNVIISLKDVEEKLRIGTSGGE
jgi:hypothetical protein